MTRMVTPGGAAGTSSSGAVLFGAGVGAASAVVTSRPAIAAPTDRYLFMRPASLFASRLSVGTGDVGRDHVHGEHRRDGGVDAGFRIRILFRQLAEGVVHARDVHGE